MFGFQYNYVTYRRLCYYAPRVNPSTIVGGSAIFGLSALIKLGLRNILRENSHYLGVYFAYVRRSPSLTEPSLDG